MREKVAKGWLTWGKGGIWFLNADGYRCGQEETLFYQFWHATSQTGGWLPPQVARRPSASMENKSVKIRLPKNFAGLAGPRIDFRQNVYPNPSKSNKIQ